LSIALCIPCFGDSYLQLIIPFSLAPSEPIGIIYKVVLGTLTLLILLLSIRPTINLFSRRQLMNASFDFRYVTAGGWADFADTPYDPNDPTIRTFPAAQRGRVAAFRPAGDYARILAEHNMIMMIGDTLFVHGGILPHHVQYGLDDINRDVQRWMLGDGGMPTIIDGADSPVWTRLYSDTAAPAACNQLEQVLDMTGARRMVVAHTVQDMINSACHQQVWRIDVGMSSYYGGIRSVLEITGNNVRVID
jgi:hypothetical protein